MGFCSREALNVPRGERYELCRSVHAEANAIISATRRDMRGRHPVPRGPGRPDRRAPLGRHLLSPCAAATSSTPGLERVVIRQTPEKFEVVRVQDWVDGDDLSLPEKI